MKKIVSLILVVMMVAALSITSFAADSGINTVYTETDDGITVQVYLKNVSKISGIVHKLNLKSSQVTYVEGSATLSNLSATWSVTPAQASSRITMSLVTSNESDANLFTAGEDEVLVLTYKLTRIDESFDESAFAYKTTNLAKCFYNLPGGDSTNYDYTTKVYDYVDNRGGNTVEEEWTAADAPADFVAPTVEGEVRKVVVFGKNAEGAASTLTAGNYGVRFGGNEYVGMADVTGQYWAIVLVDTDGKYITPGYTYEGTAFAGTFSWPVSVSAN